MNCLSPLVLNHTADELRSIVDEATTIVAAIGRQVDRARKADALRSEIVSKIAVMKKNIIQIELNQQRRENLLNVDVDEEGGGGGEEGEEGEEARSEAECARDRARDNEAGARALMEAEAERVRASARARARSSASASARASASASALENARMEQEQNRRQIEKRDAQLSAQMSIQTEYDIDLQDNIAKRDKKRKLEVFDMIHFSAVRAATHLAMSSNVDYMRMFFYNT